MTSVSAEFLSVDPYLKNAFSSAVKFDISHKSGQSNALRDGRQKDVGEAEEINIQSTPTKQWEVDVRPQVPTRKWLQNYGLRKYRLHMDQILPSIGFKLCDEFDSSMKRPISSRYGQGLFQQILGADGKTFNITCSREKLFQLKKRLIQAIALYRRRLEWLTSESRRIFGVVEEKAVTIVMDIRNMSPEQFDQYRSALQRVLREQFQHVTKFNMIRAAEEVQLYSSECIPLSHDTLENAIQWMWGLDRLAPVSNTACAEAVLRAMMDSHNEAVYLFTEGNSVNCCRELLLEKVNSVQRKIPVHVVSFNCDSSDTIKFLRNFTTVTGGRFHAYAVVMEMDAYEPLPTDPLTSKANILLKRKTFGGIPPGAGVREDVVLLFEEMEEARNNLQQLEILIERSPEPNRVLSESAKGEKAEKEEKDEQYMSSKQWLAVYGLEARKLNLYNILSGLAFKHQDGVVEVMERPTNDQTDAVGHEKLINARYCERFPVVRWKDGRVVHVQVTPEVHRNYEQRMQVALNSFQQRIDWLKQGSRALFGTVVEDEIYILIDTSASMQHSIQFVKERLFVLMQEQLRHKAKFNMIAFNSKVVGWRDRLVEVTERSLQSAWNWVQGLTCWGSTNTYAAIQTALSDTHAQAIYLLSDGRPDQPPKSIIAQVQMQNLVPIHTISFNCNDKDANQFLYDLAQATEGRYHYFSENCSPVEQPDAWQSQDIKLLKDEMSRGFEYLDQLAELRDQCASLAWKKEVDALKKCSKGHATPDTPGRVSAVPPLEPREVFRPSSPPRPSSAPPQSPRHTPTPPPRSSSAAGHRPSSAVGHRPSSASGHRPMKSLHSPRRPQSAKASHQAVRSSHKGRKLVAGHTRTSLLRTLNSSGRFSPSEWLLPETARLFEQQSERQRQLAETVDKGDSKHRQRRQRLAKSYESSSKIWLKKHGLVAKRLTILDALAPTLVPHRSKYIPILDKHVLARVFDEVLPIAHVSGGAKNRVNLVNPNAVNLKEYEEKLEKALARYRQRLSTMVWDALPESVKEEFDSEEPVPFSEHRGKFMQALSEAGWPVAEEDISALEHEIERGEKFLQQSKDLHRAASEAASDTLSDVSSPRSLRRSLSNSGAASQSVDQILQVEDDKIITTPTTPRVGSSSHTPRPPDSPTPRSRDRVTPRSANTAENVSAPLGNSTPRPPDKKKDWGRHDDKNRQRKGVKAPVAKGKGRVMVSTLRGTRVIARNDKDGLYYPGKVLKCPNVRHATVQFTDGEREVLTRFILPMSGAIACPPLAVGDYALVQVVNLEHASECYVPCIVQFTPQLRQTQAQFYTVMLYNGQKVTTRRVHLVKISKERFELSARYIAAVQGEDRAEVDDKVYVSRNRKRSEDRRERERPQRSPSANSEELRSRSRTPSRSRSRSRSRSPESPGRPRSPTPGIGLRQSPSPPRSISRTPTSPQQQQMTTAASPDRNSGSRTGSRSSSPRRSRSRSRSGSPATHLSAQQRELEALKLELEKQQNQQARERKRLRRKVKKLSRMKRELLEEKKDSTDQERAAENEQEQEEEEAPLLTPRLLRLRRTLPELQVAEEVLARFSDDGWYYRGTIQQYLGDLSYIVEDATGYIERIWREDIISDYDDNAPPLKEGDRVVAQHPSHSSSYAPGCVLAVDEVLQKAVIKFYDGQEGTVLRAEIYHLPQEKYNLDVLHIQQRQQSMLGLSVVARDDRTGEYFPGKVMGVEDGGQQYIIRWSDGTQARQLPVHIFSAMTKRRPRLLIGDRVLALANPNQVVFLPGQITGAQGSGLVVRFCDGQVRDDVNPLFCYWLSQPYAEEASYFWKISQPDFGKKR